MPDQDVAELAAHVREARVALEKTHDGILALLGHAWLLQYKDLRELIRRVDHEIGAVQRSLLSLHDVLASFTAGAEPSPPDPDTEA